MYSKDCINNKASLSLSMQPLLTLSMMALMALGTYTICSADQNSPTTSGQQAAGAPEATQLPVPKLRLRIAIDQAKIEEHRSDVTLPRDLKESLHALLVERLLKSGRFQVMEREATAQDAAKREDEVDRQKRESLPEGSAAATAAPRQRRTAAQYIITPTIVGLQDTGGKDNGVTLGGIHVGGKKTQTTLSINIRISNAETSETIDSFTAEGKISESTKTFTVDRGLLNFGNSETKQTPISRIVGLTVDDAVSKISEHMAKEPWYALVALQDPTTHRVIITAGLESGVEVGMEFMVNQTGAVVRNPDTGDIISRGDETPVGRIRIVRVDRGAAYADVISGDGYKAGNIVRLVADK